MDQGSGTGSERKRPLKPYRKPKEKHVLYGSPITACSYIFEFKSDVFQDRGKIFTAMFGKSYPFWKDFPEYLEYYTGKAEEIFLKKGNVFYYTTNYDDSSRIITWYAWMNEKYPTYFHVDVMWRVLKSDLILFRDEVLTPILNVVYNNDPPQLRRVAFRYSNHALHRKRFFKT